MQVTSFTRSFLCCISKNNASLAFTHKAINAAKKRYPDLKLLRQGTRHVVYVVPSKMNCVALMITFDKVN